MRDLRPEASVHASERLRGRHLIQTPFDEFGADAADPSVMTERDAVKLAKRAEKEEKNQRAAFAAHQAQVEEAVAGEAPQIVRNAGGGGARDLHLEDFSVSNGGPDLIENASVIMAFGRRYDP